jgi:hypothetical protein
LKSLLTALQKVFSEENFIDGLSIGEKGHRFSIEKAPEEQAIGIDLRHCDNWPKKQERCDALFVCFPMGAAFLVVLVELKSPSKIHAIDQLSNSASVLCQNSRSGLDIHNRSVTARVQSKYGEGHRKLVLGVIVTNRSLPKRFREKKEQRIQKGLKIKSVTAKSLAVSVQVLSRWLG